MDLFVCDFAANSFSWRADLYFESSCICAQGYRISSFKGSPPSKVWQCKLFYLHIILSWRLSTLLLLKINGFCIHQKAGYTMAGYLSFRTSSFLAVLIPLFAIALYQVADNEWYAMLSSGQVRRTHWSNTQSRAAPYFQCPALPCLLWSHESCTVPIAFMFERDSNPSDTGLSHTSKLSLVSKCFRNFTFSWLVSPQSNSPSALHQYYITTY